MRKSIIYIGEVIGVVGIKGHLKIKTFLLKPGTIEEIGPVFFEGKNDLYKVNFIRNHKGKAIISLENNYDRNKAELFIGKKLFINRNQLPLLKENEYYLRDLLGFVIEKINGTELGIVKNIKNFGADDLIEVEQKYKKSFFLPLNEENIKKIDLNNKIIIADPIKGIIT